MAADDTLDKDQGELDREIDAKVDSLFVEGDPQGQEDVPSSEEDHLKGLKEHFLALEWEIDMETLEKISQEIQSLQTRYSEGPLANLLGWMLQVAEKIRARGSELDQDTMKLFHQLKDGFLRLAEDPSQDSDPILDPLKAEMERLLGPVEEEEPTITLETAVGEEEVLFEELDRIMEEAPPSEEGPVVEEDAIPEAEAGPEERPVALQETAEEEMLGVGEAVEDTALESAEEFSWEMESAEEVVPDEGHEEIPTVAEERPEAAELGTISKAFAESGAQLQHLLERFQGPDGPFGVNALFEELRQRFQDFAESLHATVASLQEQIQALDGLDRIIKPAEPEATPEADLNREEILFVSVSSRIFGIPMPSVQGIFRVPADAVPQVLTMTEMNLKGKSVPIVPLWRKIGLGKELYTFPKEEKRVLLVRSGTGELGLLVDRVLARQEVPLRPVKDQEHAFFTGLVTVEKWAFVVDPKAL